MTSLHIDCANNCLQEAQARVFLVWPPYTVHIAAKHAQMEISTRNLIIFPLNLESTRAKVGNLMTHFFMASGLPPASWDFYLQGLFQLCVSVLTICGTQCRPLGSQ